MEDALVQRTTVKWKQTITEVLILVLMEDALVHTDPVTSPAWNWGLNPCFNGRCTRTQVFDNALVSDNAVLILVLMEDALVPCEDFANLMRCTVLILVLMEDALVPGGILDERDSWLAVLILVLMEDALVQPSKMPLLCSR